MLPCTAHGIAVLLCAAGASLLLQGCAKGSSNSTPKPGECPGGFKFNLVTQSNYWKSKMTVSFWTSEDHTFRATETIDGVGASKLSLLDLATYDTISIPEENITATGVVVYKKGTDATLVVRNHTENCTIAPLGDPWGVVEGFIKGLDDFWNSDATCEISGGNAVFEKRNVYSAFFGNLSFDVKFEVDQSTLFYRYIALKTVIRSPMERFRFLDDTEISFVMDITNATEHGPSDGDLDYDSWGVPCVPPEPMRDIDSPDKILDVLPLGLSGPLGVALDVANSRRMLRFSEHEPAPSPNEARSTVTV